MKAAVYDASGPQRGVLRLVDLPRPEPAPGEVRVRLAFSGVNPTDIKAREGHSSAARSEGMVVPHHDGAGWIDGVGLGVPERRLGERVWVFNAQWQRELGTAAEWIALPAEQAVALPDGVSLEQGAALGIPAITAHASVSAGGALAGHTVLVQGGAGAVGHAAVQLARRAGARVVATVSGPEKARLAEAAGADLVVNYREDDVVAAVMGYAPDGVDLVVEVDIEGNLAQDACMLAPGGAVVSYRRPGGPVRIPVELSQHNAVVRFLLTYTLPDDVRSRAVREITQALAAGEFQPLPSHVYGLGDIATAHEAVARGRPGRHILAVREEGRAYAPSTA